MENNRSHESTHAPCEQETRDALLVALHAQTLDLLHVLELTDGQILERVAAALRVVRIAVGRHIRRRRGRRRRRLVVAKRLGELGARAADRAGNHRAADVLLLQADRGGHGSGGRGRVGGRNGRGARGGR